MLEVKKAAKKVDPDIDIKKEQENVKYWNGRLKTFTEETGFRRLYHRENPA